MNLGNVNFNFEEKIDSSDEDEEDSVKGNPDEFSWDFEIRDIKEYVQKYKLEAKIDPRNSIYIIRTLDSPSVELRMVCSVERGIRVTHVDEAEHFDKRLYESFSDALMEYSEVFKAKYFDFGTEEEVTDQ